MIKKFFYIVVFAALAGLAAPAGAQTITEVHQLSFGEFAVRANNTVPAALTVTPDNDTFGDYEFVVMAPGQRGEYLFTGFPPDVSFFLGVDLPNPPSEGGVVLDNATDASGGAGPVFTLTDLTIADGGVMVSDSAGEATLYIGATLRNSGDGQRYNGGVYNGTYNITIYY